ncbi:uncharacterized protein LOC119869305 [Canis lupus familiaris]|uniref:uncharacterized protein LOC119869305 n=1 Tax=Canis lupus familiaris TaxID=9615 RepID=UPI0018F5AC5C|nr:uncharacterized protein LOC119869305 [Canis lupus familiaris]
MRWRQEAVGPEPSSIVVSSSGCAVSSGACPNQTAPVEGGRLRLCPATPDFCLAPSSPHHFSEPSSSLPWPGSQVSRPRAGVWVVSTHRSSHLPVLLQLVKQPHLNTWIPGALATWGLKSTYYVADTVIAPRKPQPLRTAVFWKPRRRRKPGAREGGAQKGQMLEKTPVPGATQENPLLSCPEASQPSMTFLILSPEGGFHSQDSCWAVSFRAARSARGVSHTPHL